MSAWALKEQSDHKLYYTLIKGILLVVGVDVGRVPVVRLYVEFTDNFLINCCAHNNSVLQLSCVHNVIFTGI